MYIDKIKTFFKQLNTKGVVLIYILLMMVTPIVPRFTSTYLTTYFYMAVVVATVLFTFIACTIENIREMVVLLFPFIVYELVAMISADNSDILLSGYQVLLFLLPVCVGFYIVKNLCFIELYSPFLVIIIAITCLTTIIGCAVNPNAARTLATTATSQDSTAVAYDWQNIGGYGFVYSSVLLYPFVILAFKMKKLNIFFTVALTAIVFYMAIQAEYTYALLLLLMSTLLFFVKRDISIKKFIVLMLVFVVFVLMFRVAIAAFLSYIGNLLGNASMVDKVNAAFLGTEAVDNFDDDRGALYWRSLQMFLNNPLFGSLGGGSRYTGGHSFLIDTIGLYGLVGAGLLFLMYRGIYRTFFLPMKGKPGYVFAFWIFIQTLMLSSINTGMWLNVLCLYAPLFFCAVYGKRVYLDAVKPELSPLFPVRVLESKDTRA